MKYLLALLLITPAFAQPSYDSALAACRAHSLTVPVDHPGKLAQAQEADFQKCIDANLPDPQRRTLALYNEKLGWCNQDANNAMNLDKLITAAERTKMVADCLGGKQ